MLEIKKVKVFSLLKALRRWLGIPTPNSSGLLCISRGTLISSRTLWERIINKAGALHHIKEILQNSCCALLSPPPPSCTHTSFWMHSNSSLLTSSSVMFSTWLYLDCNFLVFWKMEYCKSCQGEYFNVYLSLWLWKQLKAFLRLCMSTWSVDLEQRDDSRYVKRTFFCEAWKQNILVSNFLKQHEVTLQPCSPFQLAVSTSTTWTECSTKTSALSLNQAGENLPFDRRTPTSSPPQCIVTCSPTLFGTQRECQNI